MMGSEPSTGLDLRRMIGMQERLKMGKSACLHANNRILCALVTRNRLPFLLTMLSKKPHAERKRMIASSYSKSNIQNSPYLDDIAKAIFSGRMRNQLHAWARDDTTVDVLEKNKACMMDFTSTWLYGMDHGSNLLADSIEAERFFDPFKKSFLGFFWRTEFHKAAKLLQYLGIHIIPQAVSRSQRIVEQWNSTMCQKAHSRKPDEMPMLENADPIKSPLVYTQLRHGLERSGLPQDQVEATLSRELFDHLTASTEASGNTLAYVLHELTQRPQLQRALRSELHQSAASNAGNVTHSDLEALPILDAVLKETMRLRTQGPGPWPRRVPAAGCRLGTFDNIPPGTVVSASGYTLHHNAAVFPNPEEFRPDRWLDADAEKLREMMRWYWPFGSGPYGCTGQHFAVRSRSHLIPYPGFLRLGRTDRK